jgi:hypothetical protein
LAGVISPTAVSLFINGELKVSRANTDPILYRGAELWVGRLPNTEHDFRGNLDDLRIYARDLSAMEIGRLAAGNP